VHDFYLADVVASHPRGLESVCFLCLQSQSDLVTLYISSAPLTYTVEWSWEHFQSSRNDEKGKTTTKNHKLIVFPSSKTFILFLTFHYWGGLVFDVIMGSKEIINK
jgi:hypothetical protein